LGWGAQIRGIEYGDEDEDDDEYGAEDGAEFLRFASVGRAS
jgi:hypothetical protein